MNSPKTGLYTIHVQISLCREECKELISTPLRDGARKAWSKMFFAEMTATLAAAGVFSKALPSISEVLYTESISLFHVTDWPRGAEIVRGEIESLGLLADSRIGWLDPDEGVVRAIHPQDQPTVEARSFLATLKQKALSKESLKSLKLLLSSLGKKPK